MERQHSLGKIIQKRLQPENDKDTFDKNQSLQTANSCKCSSAAIQADGCSFMYCYVGHIDNSF